ncbi:PHD finger protein 7-like [Numida meleagris]|uniref:PHD finger protein 7-like n=1 Tax=Numida meleagris TaxID=8996 RepID=UPI000B3E2774|nr:PHD finger protein 7-like [Numida meleagris]
MSKGKKRAASSWGPGEKCVLCIQSDADPNIYGRKRIISGIYFHEFCAVFSSRLFQQARSDKKNDHLSTLDIIHTVQQAEQRLCFVCGKRGASITCAEAGCNRSFHFPCALEAECVTQHFQQYR